MSYWTVKRKVKKEKKIIGRQFAGADVTHASNCDDSNTVLIHSQMTISHLI